MSTSRPDRPDHPDQGWKPNNRPQSYVPGGFPPTPRLEPRPTHQLPPRTIALNFMTELDDLFRLDGGIDVLDKNVHQKYPTPSCPVALRPPC